VTPIDAPLRVSSLARFGMNSPNAQRLVQFYEQALGAQVELRARYVRHLVSDEAGIRGAAERTVLRLGDARLELLEFEEAGRPYPSDLSASDPRFQHLALVVANMQAAMQRLSQTQGWAPISRVGPERLPNNDGNVTAFKFRDPDGHPLEFLQFAAGKTPPHWRNVQSMDSPLGIDHSALCVSEAARSVRFYESLGLELSSHTLNTGIEQERLDDVPDARVDVISLTPERTTPHVELLHYHARSPDARSPDARSRTAHEGLRAHDIAAIRIVFKSGIASDEAPRLVQDPDGHFLQLDSGAGFS
jgi:catechol 2,3-dioxygenase-like lactoylglutathione lyase family enzyme